MTGVTKLGLRLLQAQSSHQAVRLVTRGALAVPQRRMGHLQASTDLGMTFGAGARLAEAIAFLQLRLDLGCPTHGDHQADEGW